MRLLWLKSEALISHTTSFCEMLFSLRLPPYTLYYLPFLPEFLYRLQYKDIVPCAQLFRCRISSSMVLLRSFKSKYKPRTYSLSTSTQPYILIAFIIFYTSDTFLRGVPLLSLRPASTTCTTATGCIARGCTVLLLPSLAMISSFRETVLRMTTSIKEEMSTAALLSVRGLLANIYNLRNVTISCTLFFGTIPNTPPSISFTRLINRTIMLTSFSPPSLTFIRRNHPKQRTNS